MRYLIAESGTPEDRRRRRDDVGRSSGESYAVTLAEMAPGSAIELAHPTDEGAPHWAAHDVARFDAVFITGSPMHVYETSPAVERQLDFMRAVFASGTPSFGSCAGLQVAVAAAGGKVREMRARLEAGISRRITASAAGRGHPLLAGRPAVWDAPALHTDEVESLPPGATLLAGNAVTPIQAAEIRYDRGIFWGVQYHPELSLAEIAAALRREADALIKSGIADDQAQIEGQAERFDALDCSPDSLTLQWLLGVDDELAREDRRRLEIRNFLDAAPELDRR